MPQPQITPIAGPRSGEGSSVNVNAALRLARSIDTAGEGIGRFMEQKAAEEAEKLRIQAEQDVLRTGGQAFGEAVQSGAIRKTQNPFYVDAYNSNRAQLLGRQQLAQLQMDAASWEERDDPVAFQRRWAQSVGEIGAVFEDTTAGLGAFQAVAAEKTSQVLAANQAHNARRIEIEQDNASASQVALTIQEIRSLPGGVLGNRDEAQARLEALKAQYLQLGNSASEWDSIVLEGITSAGFSTLDPTVLELASIESAQGTGPLNALPDVAQQMSQNRYYIEQAMFAATRREQEADRLQRISEVTAITDWVNENWSLQILEGTLEREDFIASAREAGFTDATVVMEGLKIVVDSNRLLEGAEGSGVQTARNTAAIEVFQRAQTEGATTDLVNTIRARVADGTFDLNTAEQYLGTAYDTSRRKADEAREGSGSSLVFAKGVAETASQVFSNTEQFARGAISDMVTEFPQIYVSDGETDAIIARARAAASTVMQMGGSNPDAILAAQDSIVADILAKTEIEDRRIAEAARISEIALTAVGRGATPSGQSE